ncbi:Vacuolar sorting-associated 11 like [Pyrenophora seminiperda CCB06]|uniref:Vacuolar sorting-associated 11 like n=1 Tax=Pyrenophora seminiperda CCB06 TaxID=1302712 RepID=A0A3M7M3P3_9PLEO|nr:Vacuolar sorting-associated 11 like [Pyrenophora seminiperda CCB06]
MTQQRVMEAVRAPAMLQQELEIGRPLYEPPPEPSVPWSDLMKFTPGEVSEQTESSTCEPPTTDPSDTHLRITQKDPLSTSSQPGRAGSSGLRSSPLKSEGFHAQTNHVEQKSLPSHSSLAADPDMPPTAPPVSQRSDKEEARKPTRRSKTKVSTQGSDDDFMAIGLPVDQYKPRPSRSRSLKVDSEDHTDYSIRPEKTRRRRTAASVVATNTVTTPEKVRQICDMGFTPSTTTRALERNNGDVMHTIDWLVSNNVNHDELAPQSPPRTKSASKKATQVPAMDSDAIQDIMRNLNEYRRDESEVETLASDSIAVQCEATNNATTSTNTGLLPDMGPITSPTKVQVIIPKKSPRPVPTHPADATIASSKKAKRRKTTLDKPEEEPIASTSDVPENTNEKKKRGRPKKAASTVAPIELPEPTSEVSDQDANKEYRDGNLQSIPPNSASETAQLESETELKETKLLAPTESESPAKSNPPSNPPPAIASATPEQSTKPATASPITKGKVPYRVGLSKRARITPLLRTLKKS